MISRKPKLLIIEDETPILNGLVDLFTFHGFDVDTETDGARGLKKALAFQYHLVLLDVMLPTMDGFEVCNKIRSKDRKLPIIMLTALTSDDDIVKALSLGADDYISKPFSVQQLVARVNAALRRSEMFQTDLKKISIGGLEINPVTLEGTKGSEVLTFTRREIEILTYLKAHDTRPVSRSELLKEVWGYVNPEWMETRTVDIHITKLRRKIEQDPLHPKQLITVRGEGYRLVSD